MRKIGLRREVIASTIIGSAALFLLAGCTGDAQDTRYTKTESPTPSSTISPTPTPTETSAPTESTPTPADVDNIQ